MNYVVATYPIMQATVIPNFLFIPCLAISLQQESDIKSHIREKLEDKLQKFESKAKELGDARADASTDMGAAVKLLGEEIGEDFKKIARHF